MTHLHPTNGEDQLHGNPSIPHHSNAPGVLQAPCQAVNCVPVSEHQHMGAVCYSLRFNPTFMGRTMVPIREMMDSLGPSSGRADQ